MKDKTSNGKNEEVKLSIDKVDKTDTSYGKIIITAVLTAILTSFTQYLLQTQKMSAEQEYWEKRYQIENIDRINTQRIQLLDELNRDLLQLEVKAKEIKIGAAASRYITDPNEVKEFTNKLIQYHKDLYLFSARSTFASIYFGNKVDSLILLVGNALQSNFQKNNLFQNRSGFDLPEFNLDFETTDTLTKGKISLIKAMYEEISNSSILKKE